MRVIAGKARGRKLRAPKGFATRPTPDRVKEALFSALGPMIAGCRVLDLFAGSGALGIEALSRGASHATFVEQDPAALCALRANLLAAFPHLDDGSQPHTVLPTQVMRALQHLAAERAAFNLILLDPPYAHALIPATLHRIAALRLLAEDGVIVAEHGSRDGSPLAPAVLQCDGLRRYGDVSVSFYRVAESL